MDSSIAYLSARATAVVANLDARQVRRATEEDLLPHSLISDHHYMLIAAPLLRFYFEKENELHADFRRRIINEMAKKWLEDARYHFCMRIISVAGSELSGTERVSAIKKLRNDFTHADLKPTNVLKHSEVVHCINDMVWHTADITIALASHFTESFESYLDLKKAEGLVSKDPEVLSGLPVFAGTRIPVHDVANSLAAGDSEEVLLSAYPRLTSEMIRLASIYAKAYPLRGRPRGSFLPLPDNMTAVSKPASSRRPN